jgi:hypothetical protein
LTIWNIFTIVPGSANHLIDVCGPTVALGHEEVKRLAVEAVVADGDVAPLPLHRTSLPFTKKTKGEAVVLPRVCVAERPSGATAKGEDDRMLRRRADTALLLPSQCGVQVLTATDAVIGSYHGAARQSQHRAFLNS